MIITKTRRLVVRMGQYESHEVVAQVQVDTDKDAVYEPVAEGLDRILDDLLITDVEDAHMNTSDEDSFIHTYYEDKRS